MPNGSIGTLHEEMNTSKLGLYFQHSQVCSKLEFLLPCYLLDWQGKLYGSLV